MPFFCAIDEEMDQICSSKVNFESNKSPINLNESHTETSILLIIRAGWGGCNVLDLLKTILWVFFAFNFIPHDVHHSFILVRSLFIDSATDALNSGDGTGPLV